MRTLRDIEANLTTVHMVMARANQNHADMMKLMDENVARLRAERQACPEYHEALRAAQEPTRIKLRAPQAFPVSQAISAPDTYDNGWRG